MATDGTSVTQLTATRSADDHRPSGVVARLHEIVFSSDRGSQSDDEIWIMSALTALDRCSLTNNTDEDGGPTGRRTARSSRSHRPRQQ